MSSLEHLEERLTAVERAVVDGDHQLDDLSKIEPIVENLEELTTRVDKFESRLLDVEAGLEAMEGYVGNIQSVNQDVERQANIAIVSVDRVETQLEELERTLDVSTITAMQDQLADLEDDLSEIQAEIEETADDEDPFGEFVFDDEDESDDETGTMDLSGTVEQDEESETGDTDEDDDTFTSRDELKELAESTDIDTDDVDQVLRRDTGTDQEEAAVQSTSDD